MAGLTDRENRQTLYTLPVLLRYTLTPTATRFHLDALGGITILHSAFHYIQTTTPTTAGYPYDGTFDNGQTRASLTLGPALRYSLTPSLQLTATSLVNMTLSRDSYSEFRDRLFWNFQAGLHYSFGQR